MLGVLPAHLKVHLLLLVIELLLMPRRRDDDATANTNGTAANTSNTSSSSSSNLLPLHLLVVTQPVPRHRDRLDAEPPYLSVGARRGGVCGPWGPESHKAVVFPPAGDAVFREVDIEHLAPLAEVSPDHGLGDRRGNTADVDSRPRAARETTGERCCC